MTEKERVWDEIQIRMKERTKITEELALLWDRYYILNKKKKDE